MMNNVIDGYARLEAKMDALGGRDVIGIASRGLFVLVLLPYYINSAMTKIDGLGLSAGAFAQILPSIAEQYLYDITAIPFFPWHLIVWAGTLAEFILPILILVGFMTRLAALGMIGFVIVQTYVDVVFHRAALGRLFNGMPTELVDQRLLWGMLLGWIFYVGAGYFSVGGAVAKILRPKK